MNLPEQSLKVQQGQEIFSIIRNPEFRGQFTVKQGHRYWDQFTSFIHNNMVVVLGLIEIVKEKELAPLREENERLKRVTERYRKGTMERDLEIIRLHQNGKSSIRIAKQVSISRTAVMKALRRLGLIPIEKQVTKSNL